MADLEIVMVLNRDKVKSAVDDHINDAKRMVDTTDDANKQELAAVRKRITAEEALRLATNQRIGQINDSKVAQALAAIKKEELAQASLFTRIKAGGSAVAELASSYSGFGQVASQAVQLVAGYWKALDDDIDGSVKRLTSYEEKLRELANLQGQLGKTGGVLVDQLQFRARTSQTADEARTFQAGALNTGQASIGGGFINKDEFDKLLEKAGKYQAASGADPTAIGELAGILPQMIGKIGQSADEVFRRMVGIFDTLQLGGSDLGPAVRAFKENAPLIGQGTVNSPEQLAAVTSAYSVGNSGREATLVQQLLRATNLGQLKMAKAGTEGSIASAQYYKGLGVTDQMDAVQVAQAVAADIMRQQDALKGQLNPNGTAKQLNIQQYLASKGFEGEEANTPLTEFAKALNSGSFGKTFGARQSVNSAPTIADANARADAFQASLAAADRTVQLGSDIADASKASAAASFYLEARRHAFNTLRATPGSGVSGTFEDWDNNSITNPWTGKILDKVKEQQFAAARKVGVPVPADGGGIVGMLNDYSGFNWLSRQLGMGGDSGSLGGSLDSRLWSKLPSWLGGTDPAQKFYELSLQTRARGGNPLDNSELVAVLKSVVDSNNRLADSNNRLAAAQGKPPGQATPQPPPIGNPRMPRPMTR